MNLIITILPVVTKDLPILPGSRLTIFYRDSSSAMLQLVNQWLSFTYYSRSHAFRYGRKNANPTFVGIELTTCALLAGVQVFKEKIITHLDLLSIPQSGEKMSKRLGGIEGCKYKTSSWHLNRFPYDSNIGSTV